MPASPTSPGLMVLAAVPLVASLVAAGFASSLGVSAGVLIGIGSVASGALVVGLRPSASSRSPEIESVENPQVAAPVAARVPEESPEESLVEVAGAIAEDEEDEEDEELEAVLVDGDEAEARWLFPTCGPTELEVAPAEAPADGPPDTGLDADSLLERLGGDKELLGELIGLFEMDTPHRIVALREAAAADDADGVARAAHGIKSGLSNFCAHGAQERAFVLERAGREGSLPSDAVAQVDALKDCLDEVVVQLRDLCMESAA